MELIIGIPLVLVVLWITYSIYLGRQVTRLVGKQHDALEVMDFQRLESEIGKPHSVVLRQGIHRFKIEWSVQEAAESEEARKTAGAAGSIEEVQVSGSVASWPIPYGAVIKIGAKSPFFMFYLNRSGRISHAPRGAGMVRHGTF